MTLFGWIVGIAIWIIIVIGIAIVRLVFQIRTILTKILDQGWKDETERAKHRNELPWQLSGRKDDEQA
jgi:hypothetical protein